MKTAAARFAWPVACNLICPSTEEGFAYYQQMLAKILDFITTWSYDEGGCSCDKCWPWGGFLEGDEQAQQFLQELIRIYKAQEQDDHDRFAYHDYVRPPMERGACPQGKRWSIGNAM